MRLFRRSPRSKYYFPSAEDDPFKASFLKCMDRTGRTVLDNPYRAAVVGGITGLRELCEHDARIGRAFETTPQRYRELAVGVWTIAAGKSFVDGFDYSLAVRRVFDFSEDGTDRRDHELSLFELVWAKDRKGRPLTLWLATFGAFLGFYDTDTADLTPMDGRAIRSVSKISGQLTDWVLESLKAMGGASMSRSREDEELLRQWYERVSL